ncbi:uncharacterized protein LOC126580754 [Anopheles aquasalis]|uniref:uncharacterized protein LOC126580754 n=1 Tax=Anopheles aquasalis TaxID=42839 RepID=UPI00215A2F86|nr:uncharacterized protein LOC126580754 [Anopheles aquasalis]
MMTWRGRLITLQLLPAAAFLYLLALPCCCSGVDAVNDPNAILTASLACREAGNGTATAHESVLLTAYRPLFESVRKRDYLDAQSQKLHTLQEYLDDRAPYVSVGMDPTVGIPYGTEACVPELNRHFRRLVLLRVTDHHEDLRGGAYRRLEICVRTQEDSYDDAVNLLQATLVLGAGHTSP